ncbi:GAF domain-containing protein [Rhodopseudomonas palustris]|uniref:GAF domain-containing protein n=1 Tax=Rhodopseudomonas palustris TaxID=1076 RepID=A0A418VQT8_RHOPL|nr:GAF domain-containing protein [Rhodopseudomonas palustris]
MRSAGGREIDAVLQRLRNSEDVGAELLRVLDIAIGLTCADLGTLQRFDERADCLTIVASRGFSREALGFFGIVRRDSSTSCAAALTRRMSIFVADISTNYLYVGTRQLDALRASGISAVHSAPLISSNGSLWGVFSTHFREPQIESQFDESPLNRFALKVANSLTQRDGSALGEHLRGRPVSERCQSGEARWRQP